MKAITRRHGLRCLCALPLLPLLTACGQQGSASVQAQDFQAGTSCELDGMLLADYPGPKAQIHYQGAEKPTFLCDTVELFSLLLQPEQVRPVQAAYVQDMGRADWERPLGNWVDAKTCHYVRGSKRKGSMGPTLASFARREDALAFAKQWGGEVLAFSAITPAMADLSGGALHDSRM
jgi:copper chaperone NosL